MRYQCEIEGLNRSYIEIKDQWTLKERRLYYEKDDAVSKEILCRKIVSVWIEAVDAPPIASVDEMLDDERWECVDVRIQGWLAGVVAGHLRWLNSLGFTTGLRRLDTTGETSTQTKPSPTPSPTTSS